MTLADLRDYLREQLDDTAQPYLWSDARLDQYINEAQAEANLCARLLYSGLEAGSYKVTLAASTRDYAEDSRVLFVEQCVLASTGARLVRTTSASLDRLYSNWRTASGAPRYFVTDLAPKTFTVYPTPTAVDTVYRRVWYKPAALVNDGDTPEIEDHWHTEMIFWAIYRALSRKDSQTYSPKEAAEALQQFQASFGLRPSAAQLRAWQEYGATATIRARPPRD